METEEVEPWFGKIDELLQFCRKRGMYFQVLQTYSNVELDCAEYTVRGKIRMTSPYPSFDVGIAEVQWLRAKR